MKKTILFTLIFISALTLTSCNKPSPLPEPKDSKTNLSQKTETKTQEDVLDKTVSENNSIETIEKELDDTIILDEDFSDLE